jgi:1-deoxy-D-xylulose-5-phosphate synthase
MTLMSPKDENELQHMLYTAVEHKGPIAVRYPRGNGAGVTLDEKLIKLPIGKGEIVRRGENALLVCFGPVIQNALVAAKTLEENHGITCTVVNARFAKPLDTELLRNELPKYEMICTVEDHALQGGFGSAVVEFANDEGISLKCAIKRFGVQDAYVPHGSQSEQHVMNGYDAKSITDFILAHVDAKRMVA